MPNEHAALFCLNSLFSAWVKIAVLALLVNIGTAHAAFPSLELFSNGGSTTATGPILTAQQNTYYLNANNPDDDNNTSYSPTTTVSLAIANQQYSSANFATTGAPNGNALMFGGEGNNNNSSVATATIYVPLSTKGAPSNNVFTASSNTPSGQGINTNSNYGTRFYVSTDPLQRRGLSRSGRHYMGDITITFSRPIIKPVIHVAGLGGKAGSGLGFSAEFDLVTSGFSLAQLSGSSELTVNSTQILNNSQTINANTGSGGASGSVVINGGAVSSVTFKVYLRGDNKGSSWGGSGTQSGDAFVFSAGSMDASVDLSAVKKQRVGVTGTFTDADIIIPLNGTVQYQLVLTNNGPQYVTNATFKDILPAGLTSPSIVSNSNPTTCVSPSFTGNTLNGTFTGTQGISCTLVIQATGSSNADIINTLTITPPTTIVDLDSSNNTDSVKTRIGSGAPSVNVIVSKTDGLDSIAQGATNTYTIRVTNLSNNAVSGARLKDSAVAGLTKTGTPACTNASGNLCTAAPTNANLESAAGHTLPNLAADGGFYEVNIKATVGNVSSITNTALIDVTANGFINNGIGCTSNNGIIRSFANSTCSSNDTTSVLATNSLSFDSAIKEARLEIIPSVPTIWRGAGGQQIITITNKGPDTANNVFATYSEGLKTGVSITSVSLSNGTTACSVAGTTPDRIWKCPLGTLSNGSSANFLVNYSTTTASTLGSNQIEGTVRAGSDEFNPGSGLSESVYRIWGAEGRQTTPSKYGAFMVGYNGTGGNVTGTGNGDFGPYSYEGSSITAAWPPTQGSPSGAYLNNGIAGRNSSNYLASSNNESATIQRLLGSVSNTQVNLPREDNDSNSTDHRRAWELKTGALIPKGSTPQQVKLCIGSSSQRVDDSAYVMVNDVVQGSARDTFNDSIYETDVTLTEGYNLITYRIANRNSTNGLGGEVNAGGFGTIGLMNNGTCLPDGLNAISGIGESAKINIIDAAALVITKTNSTNFVNATGQTIYTVTVENKGPSEVTDAILKDPIANNMTKGTPICSTVSNNQCTAAFTPSVAQLQASSGFTLPKLSTGQKYVLNVPVTLNATTVNSVTNTSSVQLPNSVLGLATACVNDTVNGYTRAYDATTKTCSTADTDSIRAHVRISKTSAGGADAFNFSLTNSDVNDETITTITPGVPAISIEHDIDDPTEDLTITEALAEGFVLTGASCVDNNAVNSGNPTTSIGSLAGRTITIPAANLKAGADLSCNFNNSKLAVISLNKIANGANDTFTFTLTNTNFANAAVTTTSPASSTPVDADSTVTGNQNFTVLALGNIVTIKENTLPANWKLTSVQCKNASNVEAGTFDTSNNTYSIPATQIVAGASLNCTFTNAKQRTLTLRKTWVNARLNDAATITATGLNSLASVANTASETDTATAQAVNVGSTITLDENISTGVGLYNAALSCTRNNDSSAVTVTSNNLTMPDADVTCTYTNSRKSANLTLSKVWSNAKLNDAINITATGLTTFSSVANAANETDNAAAQTVYAGDSISFSETFTTGIASNYNAALACTGNTTALSGSNLTVNGADTDINCAYTNSRIVQQLNLSKTWQNGVNGHTATVTTTGSSNSAGFNSTAAGNNTSNGTAVSVYAGDVITLPAETFGGGATAAQYNSTLACAGGTTLTSGAVARSITISNSTTATVCTYTNSFIAPAKILVSGQVFEDNSGTTGVNSNAYNGTQETGEVGIQDSQIALTNCSSTVIATTTTNAGGDYTFSLLPVQLPTPKFCVVQTNVSGYTSVSGTSGYTRATDTITISNLGATSYSNHNFGDARLNVVLTEDGQQTIIAGGVADYPHRLTAQSVLTVTSINQTNTQQPANSTDAPWQSLLYLDTDCNGKVDAGEKLISASLPLSLKANEQVCLVQRVYAPANASMGAQHIGQLQASFAVTLADTTPITGSSIKRQDTTLLGSAGLSMQKMVRGVASCVSTPANDTGFSLQNEVPNGGYLEYEITYRNNSLKNLIDISIKDTVPVGTVFKNSNCQVSPAGTCTESKTGDALLWQTSGTLLPNQQGKVRFCVQIP